MPTWKKKEENGEVSFQHLCTPCHQRLQAGLERGGWLLLREGEPVSCGACAMNCRLTADGLWGAEETVRFAVCVACPELDDCALKGRYYC